MYLLDTNVVSELRKSKSGKADKHVKAWAEGVSSMRLYLSVITCWKSVNPFKASLSGLSKEIL